MTPGPGRGLPALAARTSGRASRPSSARLGAALPAVLASVAVLLASCDSSTPTTPVASTPTGPVPVESGGSITLVTEAGASTFNLNTPEGANFHNQLIMDRVWPQTFMIGPDLRPVLDTNLIQSAELVSTNPQTIIYKINPAAIWSDGVPITADDYIYNWKAQDATGTDVDGKPYDVASTSGYRSIKSVTGSDDGKTVTVVFSQPYSDWESLFNNLLPAHIARRVGWNNGFDAFNPAVVISGGPFEVETAVPGYEVVLARNPHYWGPAPHLDQIVFKVQPDDTQDALLLELSQAQMIYPVEPTESIVQSTKATAGFLSQVNLGLSFEHIDFNLKNPFLADPKVRQAMAEATDRKQLIADTVGKIDPHVKPLDNHIYVNSQPQYQDNSNAYSYNLAAAKNLLEQDGYSLGPDGYLEKGGKPLELRVTTTSDSSLRIGIELVFALQMRQLGVKLDVANADAATLTSFLLPAGDFDIAIFESTATPFASYTAADFQTANRAVGTGLENFGGYSNPVVDSSYDQAVAELNEATATAIYNQIDRQLWSDMVSLPLFQVPTFLAYGKQYVNISDNTSQFGPLWNAETWGVRARPVRKGTPTTS